MGSAASCGEILSMPRSEEIRGMSGTSYQPLSALLNSFKKLVEGGLSYGLGANSTTYIASCNPSMHGVGESGACNELQHDVAVGSANL
jgi:hypothetical protein